MMRSRKLGLRKTHVLAISFLAIIMSLLSLASGEGEAQDEQDLSTLSTKELAVLEKQLEKEVADSNKALESLTADTQKLRDEQETIDQESSRLSEARDSEAKLKSDRDRELEIAKADVQNKQASITRMSARANALKDQIVDLEQKLKELEEKKEETEKRYNDPSLFDVLDSRSADWGEVPRNVYNKTRNQIVPTLSGISETAARYRRRVSNTSRTLEVLASLLVYGFVCLSLYTSYKIYSKVRGSNLTIDRIIFLGDAYCALFWSLIMICYLFLLDDPLRRIQLRSPTLFFAFQLATIASYNFFILVRIVVLASELSLHALGEVLATVIVGQHYYVRIWLPTVLDEGFRGTWFFYFCYASLFWSFAAIRVENWVGPKQFRAGKDPIQASMAALRERMATMFGRRGGDRDRDLHDEEDGLVPANEQGRGREEGGSGVEELRSPPPLRPPPAPERLRPPPPPERMR